MYTSSYTISHPQIGVNLIYAISILTGIKQNIVFLLINIMKHITLDKLEEQLCK